MNELHEIDCMKHMKPLPDKFYDLAIVDVNYGIGQGGGNNHTRSRFIQAGRDTEKDL